LPARIAKRPAAPLSPPLPGCANAGKLTRTRSEAGLPTTQVYLALHIGDVFYGNVGSKDRLDFTVIGPAVNEVTRILAMSRSVEQDVLLSPAFAARSCVAALSRSAATKAAARSTSSRTRWR
jgi:adenylate cyclase